MSTSFITKAPFLKYPKRRVWSTGHPDIFTVLNAEGTERYRVLVVRAFADIPLQLLCSCEWGKHAGLVPVEKVACWHGKLVIQRRLSGGSK